MTRFTVRCQASNGTSRDVTVTARTATSACIAAVKRAAEENPTAGKWYPAYCLEV